MLGSGHHALRKALFSAQFCYQLLTSLLSWFAVGLLMLSLMTVYASAIDRATAVGSSANSGLRGCYFFLYSMLLLSQLILALVGGSVAQLASYYLVVSSVSGLIVGVSVLLGSWLASTAGISSTVLLSLGFLSGSYAVVAVLYGRAAEMASVFVQFMLSSEEGGRAPVGSQRGSPCASERACASAPIPAAPPPPPPARARPPRFHATQHALQSHCW